MSEISKAEKLAAAKKRLKQFKNQNKQEKVTTTTIVTTTTTTTTTAATISPPRSPSPSAEIETERQVNQTNFKNVFNDVLNFIIPPIPQESPTPQIPSTETPVNQSYFTNTFQDVISMIKPQPATPPTTIPTEPTETYFNPTYFTNTNYNQNFNDVSNPNTDSTNNINSPPPPPLSEEYFKNLNSSITTTTNTEISFQSNSPNIDDNNIMEVQINQQQKQQHQQDIEHSFTMPQQPSPLQPSSVSSVSSSQPVELPLFSFNNTETIQKLNPSYFTDTSTAEIDFFSTFKTNKQITEPTPISTMTTLTSISQPPPPPSQQDPLTETTHINNTILPNNLFSKEIEQQSANIESLNQLSNQITSLIDATNSDEPPSNRSPSNYTELEQRNQELANLLNIEKVQNQELKNRIINQNHEIDELKLNIDKILLDNSKKLTLEISPLQEQLQTHVQTVGILVGEKAELTASLNRYQLLATQKAGEVEDLQSQLTTSKYRVIDLEKEIINLKSVQQSHDNIEQKAMNQVSELTSQLNAMKIQWDESIDEVNELKQKNQLKQKQINELQSNLDGQDVELKLNQLRIEQLTTGNDLIESNKQIEQLIQQRLLYEHQISELNNVVQQLGQEREQANLQYQNYIQHLNKETTVLADKIQELVNDNTRLSERNDGLIKHIGELEKQIQQQMVKQQNATIPPVDANVSGNTLEADKMLLMENVSVLEERCRLFEKDQIELQQKLTQQLEQNQRNEIQMKNQIGEIGNLELLVEQLRTQVPDTKSLNATIESDKIAASRAVQQNQELKLQLQEIQNAFVQLSNDKLDLTNKLHSEQHLGREIKLKFHDIDKELITVRNQLRAKDEEMIRLTHVNNELDKQILELSQELDRLRHYEVKIETVTVYQKQLEQSKEQIRKLRLYIKQLEKESTGGMPPDVAADAREMVTLDDNNNSDNVNELDNNIVNDSIDNSKQPNDNNHHHHHHDHHHHDDHYHEHHDHHHNHSEECQRNLLDNSDNMSISSTINIATNEAMHKLQERFKRTMSEVADLMEEKERLEHLVLQLQSETETIGEYIALYQIQRRQLKRKESEKEVQLQRITNDREDMKNKLIQLNQLVEDLLVEKGVKNPKLILENLETNRQTVDVGVDSIKIIESADQIDQLEQQQQQQQQSMIDNFNKSHQLTSTVTATKILTLLSDIKEKNLSNDFSDTMPNLKHCSCCSGKLETV